MRREKINLTNDFIGKPFKGLRSAKGSADKLIAPPYDVVSREQVAEIVKKNPDSFLRVSRAEVDFDEYINPYSDKVYQQAAKNFNQLLTRKIIRADEKNSYYIYKISSDHHAQTGLVFGASINAYLDGRIKRHELTREKKELDRIKHIEAVQAQTGPVMLIHKQNKNLKAILKRITSEKTSEINTVLENWHHELWPINKIDQVEEINNHLNSIQELYIADGHHRSAAASKIFEKQKQQATTSCFLAVTFDETELRILPYNRVVRDLNQLTANEFLNKLSNTFKIDRMASNNFCNQKYCYFIYLEETWYQIKLKQIPKNIGNIIEILDTHIVEESILKPILGINDIRTDDRIDFVGGPHSIRKIANLVDSGVMKIGIALPTTAIEELLKISDNGELMPPKSTWFEPKLADGLVSLKI